MMIVMMLALACPKVDQEPWRMDVKEQQALFVAADEYWTGVRWGELSRSAQYIEDPLERARFLNSFTPGQYIDIKVLHAELDPLDEGVVITAETEVWRTGMVYVQVEEVIGGHRLQNTEQQQMWHRTAHGWYISGK